MIAFEISKNGQLLGVAGAPELAGLNAVLTACGDMSGLLSAFYDITAFGVAKGTGENSTRQYRWAVQREDGIQVGDTLTIRIIRTDSSAPPTSIHDLQLDQDEPAPPATPGRLPSLGSSPSGASPSLN
jgi:hypothetical protein